MSKKTIGLSLSLLLMALGAGAAASGCGSSVAASVCDVVCFCQQCSGAERADCEATGERSEEIATETGCELQFRVLTACLQDKNQVRCEGMRATTENCSSSRQVYEDCTRPSASSDPSGGGPGGGTGGG